MTDYTPPPREANGTTGGTTPAAARARQAGFRDGIKGLPNQRPTSGPYCAGYLYGRRRRDQTAGKD